MSTDPHGRPDPRRLSPTRAYTVAGPPVDPYPMPPRRRSRAGWWFLGVPLLLLACCGAGVVGFMINGDEAPADPPAASDEEPQVADEIADPDEAAGVGDPVRDGKFEFVVTQVETDVDQLGEGFITHTPQGAYVVVHLTVANISDRAQVFDGGAQRLIDAEGNEHKPDLAAALFLAESGDFFTVVNPGNVVDGIMAFDVPPEASLASLRLHDSFLSGGVDVALPSG